MSGRVPPGVSDAQGRRPLVPLQPPSGWIPSPFLISRFVLLLSLSSLPIFVSSRNLRFATSSPFIAFSVLLSRFPSLALDILIARLPRYFRESQIYGPAP